MFGPSGGIHFLALEPGRKRCLDSGKFVLKYYSLMHYRSLSQRRSPVIIIFKFQ